MRCEPGAWETFWHGYFDLGRSYAALRGKLDSRNDFLQRAMEYGRGIRVLRQDEWEMLVSFIISQRKSIPAIRRAVELLSERFGERLGSDGEGPVYAFPTAEALCCAGEQALQECGLGYRTRYVLHAAQQAADGTLKLLRERAGVTYVKPNDMGKDPHFSDFGYELTPNMQEIRRERRSELALQGFRLDDLMRWKGEKLIVSQRGRGAYLGHDGTTRIRHREPTPLPAQPLTIERIVEHRI